MSSYITSLSHVARMNGFTRTNYKERQRYWLILLGIDEDQLSFDKEEFSSSRSQLSVMNEAISLDPNVLRDEDKMKSHGIPSCYDQVLKDISRSLWKLDDDIREEKRKDLEFLIMSVLMNVKDDEGDPLYYYQGYNELSSVIMLACDYDVSYSILKRLSLYYLRYL